MSWILKTVYYPCNAIFDQRIIEIDKQTKFNPGQSDIGEDLFLMNRSDIFYGFHFDQNTVFHN